MSEPIRYSVKCGDEGYTIVESLGGDWVCFGEYTRLKAEVERLRNLGIKLDGYVDLLQGENERLRKAGDAMAQTANKEITRSEFGHLAVAWDFAKGEFFCPVNPDRVAQYLPKPPTAAKEGKPSV